MQFNQTKLRKRVREKQIKLNNGDKGELSASSMKDLVLEWEHMWELWNNDFRKIMLELLRYEGIIEPDVLLD